MNESDDKRREVETNVPGNWQRHSFDVSKVKKSRFISKNLIRDWVETLLKEDEWTNIHQEEHDDNLK